MKIYLFTLEELASKNSLLKFGFMGKRWRLTVHAVLWFLFLIAQITPSSLLAQFADQYTVRVTGVFNSTHVRTTHENLHTSDIPLTNENSDGTKDDASRFNKTPVVNLLLQNGSIDISKGFSGNLDISGYDIVLDECNGPLLSLQPLAGPKWNAVSPAPGLNEGVWAIAINGNDVYVGGAFINAGGNPNGDYIARWDGKSWNALGTGLNHYVTAIAIKGSDVYVGGTFTGAGGNPNANKIARWDGSTWNALGAGLSIFAGVQEIVINNNDVYVGGGNMDAGGNPNANSIARWDGSNWHALGPKFNHHVLSLAVSGNNVYVAGLFTDVGGNTNADNIARWDGSTWNALGTGLNSQVDAIAIVGSNVYAGGFFTNAGGNSQADYIARWDGSKWNALGTGLNGIVHRIAINGSNVYIGGAFTDAGGNLGANSVAYWDGTKYNGMGHGVGNVQAIAFKDSDVYVGGSFKYADGIIDANYLARWGDSDDADNDGYKNTKYGGTDCDDNNPDVHPGAKEICNGIDDNCNGLIDSADPNLIDSLPPLAVCSSVVVKLDSNCMVTITPAMVDEGSSDNCHIASRSVSPNVFTSCGNSTVTLTVTDNNGNSSTCNASVKVEDKTAPVIACPSDTSIVGFPDSSGICMANIQVPGPIVTDCDLSVAATNDFNNTSNASGTYPPGTTKVTWTARDTCGNVSTCSFDVFVTCPVCVCDSIDINIDQELGTSDTSVYHVSIFNQSAYCFSFITLTIDSIGELINWELLLPGWSVIQANPKTIHLYPPASYLPNGVSFPLIFRVAGAGEQVISSTTSWGDSIGIKTCSRTYSNLSPSQPSGTCCFTLPILNNLINNADFSSGNIGFSSDYIFDNIPALSTGAYWVGSNPAFINPSSIGNPGFVNCVDHTTGSGQMMVINGNNTTPIKRVWYKSIPVIPNTTYKFQFYWTNLSSNNINTVPVMALSINNSSSIKVGVVGSPCGWNGICKTWFSGFSTTANLAIRDYTTSTPGNDFAIDDIAFYACGPAYCTANFSATPIGSCGLYQFTSTSTNLPTNVQYMWDFDGNSNTTESTLPNPTWQFPTCGYYKVSLGIIGDGCNSGTTNYINIVDNVPPVAKCLGVGLVLDANCSVLVRPGDIDGGSSDNCQIASMSVSPNILTGCGVFPVTLTVTDWCGNSSSCVTNVQTVETVPPIIVCPPSYQLKCGINIHIPPAVTGTATATDKCTATPLITMAYTDQLFSQINPITLALCADRVERTWKATDGCGNMSTCVQIISVNDDVKPILTNCPPSVKVTGTLGPQSICSASVQVTSPTITDNCDPSPTLTNSFNNTMNASGIYPQGTTTVTWTATDNCGNVATCVFTVTVECDSCACKKPSSVTLASGGQSYNFDCANPLNQVLPCATGPVTITSDFGCVDVNGVTCAPINWQLFGPNGTQSGTVPAGSALNLTFPTVDFSKPGPYQLYMTSICPGGMDTCRCEVNWIQECPPDDCNCGMHPFDISIRYGGALNQPVKCGDVITLPPNGFFALYSSFQCQQGNCPPTAQVDWMLTGPPGFVTQNSPSPLTATPSFTIPPLSPATFTIPGTYTLTMTGHCGINDCPCVIKFCLPPPPPIVNDTAICRTAPTVYIPIYGCPAKCNYSQVRWFVKPCSATTWPVTPYQITGGSPNCASLLLLPNQYPGESCVQVYAELTMDGSCCVSKLISNIATITLCDPVGCTIKNNNGPYCQTGTPVAMQVVFPNTPPCTYTVQWYENGKAINGATGLSYQPPVLTLPPGTPSSTCYYDYIYSVVLTGPCGSDTCSTFIRIYNDNADVGKIDMIPFESQPFCRGEDATLVYSPACAALPGNPPPPPMWTWWHSTVSAGTGFTQIPGSGIMDGVINTNKLWQTTWYKVIKQNGVCPADEVPFQIVVKDALLLTNFTAVPDPCADTQVTLTVDFTPTPITGTDTDTGAPCMYVVDWYLNGNLIHTSTSNMAPVSWVYQSPTPGIGSIAGVYYAVVKDNCCPLSAKTWPIIIDPTCVPVISGPCYRCGNEPVTLQGSMVLPPKGLCLDTSGCTYQWYIITGGIWTPIPGATNLTYSPNAAGHYGLESNCNGCIRRDEHTVVQCNRIGGVCMVTGLDAQIPAGISVQIRPNPTTDFMTVQISPTPLKKGRVQVVDVNGRIRVSEIIPANQDSHTMSLTILPPGLFFVRVFENDMLVWKDKIVRIE